MSLKKKLTTLVMPEQANEVNILPVLDMLMVNDAIPMSSPGPYCWFDLEGELARLRALQWQLVPFVYDS